MMSASVVADGGIQMKSNKPSPTSDQLSNYRVYACWWWSWMSVFLNCVDLGVWPKGQTILMGAFAVLALFG